MSGSVAFFVGHHTKWLVRLADLIVGGTVHKVINRATIPVVLVPASPSAKKAGPAPTGRRRAK